MHHSTNSRAEQAFQQLLFSVLFIAAALKTQAQEKTADWYIAQTPFKMQAVKVPSFADKSFAVTNYGAIGNGQFLNTEAFAKTIDACAKAGGGKVIVPSGLWLTGPIQLQSNVNLIVEKGALIQFTTDHTQYPIIKAGSGSSSFTTASPIYGYDLKNIAITGEGVIDGAGDSWRPLKKGKATDKQWKDVVNSGGVLSNDGSVWWPSKEAMDGEAYLKNLKKTEEKPGADKYLPAREFLRPYMLFLSNCEDILIEGVTIRNSPKFVFYPNHCTNLTMRSVTIFNEWWAQNGDGIDISACKNVVIYKCTVSAGDDGICMKSSGGKKDDPAVANLQNVLVAGCTVYHAHGGFVIGSNTDGGMNNIYVTDCNFVGTDAGIRIKSNAGRGGLVKDIYLHNIFMSNIVEDAIVFDTYYEDVTAGKEAKEVMTTAHDKVPEFRDFYLSNIYCKGAKNAIKITGLPDMPVSKIKMKDMIIEAKTGMEKQNATDIQLQDVKLITAKGVEQF